MKYLILLSLATLCCARPQSLFLVGGNDGQGAPAITQEQLQGIQRGLAPILQQLQSGSFQNLHPISVLDQQPAVPAQSSGIAPNAITVPIAANPNTIDFSAGAPTAINTAALTPISVAPAGINPAAFNQFAVAPATSQFTPLNQFVVANPQLFNSVPVSAAPAFNANFAPVSPIQVSALPIQATNFHAVGGSPGFNNAIPVGFGQFGTVPASSDPFVVGTAPVSTPTVASFNAPASTAAGAPAASSNIPNVAALTATNSGQPKAFTANAEKAKAAEAAEAEAAEAAEAEAAEAGETAEAAEAAEAEAAEVEAAEAEAAEFEGAEGMEA